MRKSPLIEKPEPRTFADFRKGRNEIIVPRPEFELWLERWDWTYHQISRGELPAPFESLDAFQLACICADPVLWVQTFLREPEDPDHEDPYSLWEYQKESLRHPGHTIHKTAAEVGKTREIIAYALHKTFTVHSGSGLVGAPLATHLEEIIEAMDDQLTWNPDLGKSRYHRRHKDGWRKTPHNAFYFTNGFKIDFRPSGFDGTAFRGVHAKTFAIKDEAVKDKNVKQWSEFWRAVKPGCIGKIYSVPDGDRSCEFYKLAQRAEKNTPPDSPPCQGGDVGVETEVSLDSLKDAGSHIKNIKFRLFHWAKSLMPSPYWSPERKRFFVEQYGGEDTPEYKHNVEGLDGDPESSVFPWEQFRHVIKEIPEYRCLKIMVDSGNDEVNVYGYKCEIFPGDSGPVSRAIGLIDTVFRKSGFFDYRIMPDGTMTESDFRKVIKNFFPSAPGLKRGGADFGFSGDPSEIIVKNIIGKQERRIVRLHMKHVTYDQQCQALDALDDIYGPVESISWGTDFGNAGSAVAHDLQGLPQYQHKRYMDRLKGFMFESLTNNVDEDGEPIIDAQTGKPAKITLKELATDLIVKKIQRLSTEFPPDPDYALYFPNHTVSYSGKHRIYKKKDDHLIDADRCEILAMLLGGTIKDEFSCGSNLR